jgi:DNA-binding NtrC family response regulator
VYGVVKDHKGCVDVRTQVGIGTEFTVYLPAIREAVPEKEKTEATLKGTEDVLVVDDEKEQQELIKDVLSSLGYNVHVVADGRRAISHLKKNLPDIVVLDMFMGDDFDGLAIYAEMAKIRPGQKAVILSGFGKTDKVTEAQKLGAGPYVRKPFSIESLAGAIREELDRK